MTSHERKGAEEQLTAILNRALKGVPLVKLDAVEDVIALFTEAIDLMESNQIIDESESALPHASQGLAYDARQSNLIALAGSSTATTATNSGASSASSSDTERDDRTGGQPLVNKAVAGLATAALTVDYSSPSSKTRSLGAKAAPKDAARPAATLGLGLGKNSLAAPKQQQPGVLGLHGGHKPSSRAVTGLNALNSSSPVSGSPVSPTTPDSATDESGEAGVLKNKFVAKLASAPTNREYPSPKLGPRSLNGTPKVTTAPLVPANPAASGLGLSLPSADTLGRDATTGPGGVPTSGSPIDADDEGAEDEPDETEAGDLILTDKKNSVFNRVKSTLPITASPKQIRSSFHLLELATTHSLQQDEDDLTLKSQTAGDASAGNGPSERPAGLTGVLSSLPSGMVPSGSNNTPKPSYLRRLDSPDTHHGQLLAAKARLQLLLNKGIQLADRVDLSAMPEIKAKLEKALAKLEASLVVPTLGQ